MKFGVALVERGQPKLESGCQFKNPKQLLRCLSLKQG